MTDQKLSQIEQHNTTLSDASRFYTVLDPSGVPVRGYTEYQDIRDQIYGPTESVVCVSKGGSDLTADGSCFRSYLTIQAAIDSITDAESNKRYAIMIYPGNYTENVDLTGKPYIDLAGSAAQGSSSIVSSSGIGLTLNPTTTFIGNVKFKSTNSKAIKIPSGATGQNFRFENCVIYSTITDSYTDLIEINSGNFYFENSNLFYNHSGTGGGTHRTINVLGASNIHIHSSDLSMDISDGASADDVVVIAESDYIISSHVTTTEFDITRNGVVTGETTGYLACGTSIDKDWESNHIYIKNDGSGGTAQIYKTCASGCEIHSVSNKIKVEDFTSNYLGNILATDSLFSHFDDIVSPDGKIGDGTYEYVNSPSDGDLQISGSYLNMYDQVLTVGARGQDYTSIQDAIDSVTDAAEDKIYTILIYPGEYNENVILKSWVGIKGIGAADGVIIYSNSGNVITFGTGVSTIAHITVLATPTASGSRLLYCNSSGAHTFDNIKLKHNPTGTYATSVEINVGSLSGNDWALTYTQTGTGGGNHIALLSGTNGGFLGSIGSIDMTVAADDDIYARYVNTSLPGTSNVRSIIVSIDAKHATYSQDAYGIYIGGSPNFNFLSSTVYMVASGTGPITGNATAIAIDNGAAIVRSTGNLLSITDFGKNYYTNVVQAGDTLSSHFDDITASDGKIGAGTYEYVNSPCNGDLQISGSYLNMYDQALTVGKRGADHTVIQDTIDAITDAASNKRYVILLYPGTYTENVDLTGKPYIDLKAISTRSATIITSSSGTTLTLADQATIINDIKIRSTGGKIIEIPAVSTSIKYRFAGGAFQEQISDSTAVTAIEIKGGDVKFTRSFIHYIQTGTGGGTHRLVNITGPAKFTILTTEMTMDIVDPDDDVIGIEEEEDEVITTKLTASDLTINRTGTVTGETIGYYANGTSSNKLLNGCFILLLNGGSGGNASLIKTAGNGCVTAFQSNVLNVLNFTNNWVANISATDTVYSNFDTITAAQHNTGAGTYNAIHAHSDGDFHVERDIILQRNIEIGGTLELASGTTVNDIETTISSPGSDDSLITEKGLVNWTNGLASMYMKLDGSTPFTGKVAGITPTLGSHLVTKDYADGIAGGGGTNDLGPFVTKDLCEPVGDETDDDKYIVCSDSTSAASGIWLGHEDDIATAVDSTGTITWTFETPVAGKHGWITDEGIDYTFNGISWVATGTLIDHTTIQNIGINTHPEIDSHISNITTNPHVVTKTNVGLVNVTNDSQLKRAADDWTTVSGIAAKVTTVDLDRFLIEDSEDGQAKKYVLMQNIVDKEVAISSTDTVQDYLENKLIGTTDKITLTKIGTGGDEDLQIGIGSDLTSAITHTTSDGKNHSDVVLNNTHRTSDGKNHSDVVLNNTHRTSDGKDHSDVVLNNTSRHDQSHAFSGSDHTASTKSTVDTKISDASLISTLGAEISAITEKTSPILADLILIEDSAATNTKKKIQIKNLPGGWHGSDTRIKIGPAEFFPYNDAVWKQEIENNGGSIVDNSGKITEFITIPIYIPEGYKATAYMVYSSANIAIEIFENNISDATATSKGSGNANTEVDMTDVTSTSINYLSIVVVEADADIYGGYVTIERV